MITKKMDRTFTKFYYCINNIADLLESTPTVLNPSISPEVNFLGTINLVTMEALVLFM